MAGQEVIALVTATDREMRPVRKRLELGRVRRLRFAGAVGGKRIIAAVTGVGRQRASAMVERLIIQHAITRLIHFGFAHALHADLHTGQLLRVGQVVALGERPITLARPRPHTLLTAQDPILSPAQRLAAWAQFNADAWDLESHAVARVCSQSKVRYTAVRVVCNESDVGLPAGAPGLVKPDGRADAMGLLAFTLLNPLRLATIARMSDESAAAGRTLADEIERVVGRR